MKLIALVGMTGSGKSVVSNLIEKKGYHRIRFGDITDEILEQRGLELFEINERELRENLRKEQGMEAYAKLNVDKINKALETSDVIIDGLYSWEEYEYLKNKFPQLIILCIYTPPKQRYERLKQRIIRSRTVEESSSRDKTEIENLNKGGPIAMADYTILNTGSLDDLEKGLEIFFNWMMQNEKT